MKKFLIALLFCPVTVAFADEPDKFELIDASITEAASQLMEGKLDLKTAKALCNKVFEYAKKNNIEIRVQTTQGERTLDKHICKTDKNSEEAIDRTLKIVFAAAEQIKYAKKETYSKEMQDYMVRRAKDECKKDMYLDMMQSQGYIIDNANKTVTCSQKYNYCVISMPVKYGKKDEFYTACCIMKPARSTEQSGDNTETIGEVYVYWNNVTRGIMNTDDFGKDCNEKQKLNIE